MKWDEIVKDPEYNAEIQKIVKSRLKDDGESKAILDILSPALQHLAKANGMDPQNMDYTALVKAMLNGELTVSSDITAEPQVGYTVNFYANIK
jgi:altronate dehydratase